jgi:hypothetical protein
MPTRTVETEQARDMLHRFIDAQKLPFVCSIEQGKLRSTKQNKLQRLWIKEISEQLGDTTPEEIRGYCKLSFGVPILCEDSEMFDQRWRYITQGMSPEQKLNLMMEPMDMAITRAMTTKQKKEYLDRMGRHFAQQGIELTDPATLGLQPIDRNAA